MDFIKILPIIIKEFEKASVQYATIGGFAMGALGIMRATIDLDFLVMAEDLPKIGKIMQKYDYRCVYKTENVSQYVSEIKLFGEIDFLHAFRSISLEMLKRAKEVVVLEVKLKIKVLCPEDIIGLKLQSLVNNPSRESRESADIESMMDAFGKKLDWELIKEYFSLFTKEDRYKELKKKYGNPD